MPCKIKVANTLAKAFLLPGVFCITFVKYSEYCITWIFPSFVIDMALYGQILVLFCAPSTFFIIGLFSIKKNHPNLVSSCMACAHKSLCVAYLSGIVYFIFYLC